MISSFHSIHSQFNSIQFILSSPDHRCVHQRNLPPKLHTKTFPQKEPNSGHLCLQFSLCSWFDWTIFVMILNSIFKLTLLLCTEWFVSSVLFQPLSSSGHLENKTNMNKFGATAFLNMNITMFAANTAAWLPLVVIDERESFGDWNPDTETTTADDTFLDYGRRGRSGRHSSCAP